MTQLEMVRDGLDRIRDAVHGVLDGLPPAQLHARPAPGTNPIDWLVWHLTRVQDDHLAKAAGQTQVWHDGWLERFALDLSPDEIGYGHSEAQVDAVRAPVDLLLGYHDAVHAASTRWVATLDDDDLPRVVDESWDPPVTLAVRLVSVLQDDLMHAGQAAYARGMLERG